MSYNNRWSPFELPFKSRPLQDTHTHTHTQTHNRHTETHRDTPHIHTHIHIYTRQPLLYMLLAPSGKQHWVSHTATRAAVPRNHMRRWQPWIQVLFVFRLLLKAVCFKVKTHTHTLQQAKSHKLYEDLSGCLPGKDP